MLLTDALVNPYSDCIANLDTHKNNNHKDPEQIVLGSIGIIYCVRTRLKNLNNDSSYIDTSCRSSIQLVCGINIITGDDYTECITSLREASC